MDAILSIIYIQKLEGLTDREFASRLPRDRATWNKIKNGKKPMNDSFLLSVRRAFPEYAEMLDTLLIKSNLSGTDTVVAIIRNAPHPLQNRKFAHCFGRLKGLVLSLIRRR